MTADTFLLVVNPRAGAGRAERNLTALSDELRRGGARFDVAITKARDDATRLVREGLARDVAGIAVLGGDGTVNEALNGFFSPTGQATRPGAWLAPLPCGTGGDFARTLELPGHPRELARRFLSGTPRPVDIGWMTFRDHGGRPTSRAFLNIASFGLAGLIDRLVGDAPKWAGGSVAFALATLRARTQYRRNRGVRLRLDDGPAREAAIVNCAIANGRFFGGGMEIAPTASIDDGLFDVVVLEQVGLGAQLAIVPALYRGRILSRRGVTHARARRIVAEAIDGRGPVLLDIDGEAPGALPATFEVRPRAVLLRS